MSRRLLLTMVFTLEFLVSARAGDPCGSADRRALVFSGGGAKGAFQTGAVFHLVVQRNCDFHEFSGVSVGALNAAFLGQAAPSGDPRESHEHLAAQTRDLVGLWESIDETSKVARGRPLAFLRWGLFGLENLKDFRPFRRLLDEKISLEKLSHGRAVRVGVVSFWEGGSREIVAQSMLSEGQSASFLDYLFASAVPPVYGKLPRIRQAGESADPRLATQFSDMSLRHDTPVISYFKTCGTLKAAEGVPGTPGEAVQADPCQVIDASHGPPHSSLQQLFVVTTNPYSRSSDRIPVGDPRCCRSGSRQITNGKKILARTLELMGETIYRWDLDFMMFANDVLRWRWQAYRQVVSSTPAEGLAEAKRQLASQNPFPLESYNRDPQDPDAPPLPYEIGLVRPEKQYNEGGNLLVFKPERTREMLYCGCRAADEMMQMDFGLASLAEQCAERFPPLKKKGEEVSAQAAPKAWEPRVCQSPSARMEPMPPSQTHTAGNEALGIYGPGL